ncbi:MAG TPA: DeoR/GlpR family DNA-binding transcription regulator [Opitutales bacterium]|nr:DeoR/GlpR family DNA-binding transcription regulator [Opitutales bacterium]
MKVAKHVVEARRRRLAEMLQRHRYLGIADLCKEFGISEATVRRDLVFLEKSKLITRTYGGALADYNLRFPSFRSRRTSGSDGKQAIAQMAIGLLRPELTIFLDGGTTIFALAEALRMTPVRPLTCVTSNLPAADLLAEVDGVDVHLLGGQVLRRQSVLLGDDACRSASFWKFDLAFLGAEGMTREGVWNSSPAVVALQKAVLAESKASAILLDQSKLGRTAPAFLGGWDILTALLTDASVTSLKEEGIPTYMTKLEHITSYTASESIKQLSTPSPKSEEKKYENSALTLPTALL